MKTSTIEAALRISLGLIFVIFGPNHYLQFIKDPPGSPAANSFLNALTASGYIFQIIVLIETVAGLLLLSDKWVPLAVCLLAPIVVNIFLFHVVLDRRQLPVAVLLAIGELGLAWIHRAALKPLLHR